MSFAVLSPAFRGLQFPFRDMFVLTVDRNSFTGNNGRPSYALADPERIWVSLSNLMKISCNIYCNGLTVCTLIV